MSQTYPETTLYHPSIEGVVHICHSPEEVEAWQEQGWVEDQPNYQQSEAIVEVIKKPSGKKAAS